MRMKVEEKMKFRSAVNYSAYPLLDIIKNGHESFSLPKISSLHWLVYSIETKLILATLYKIK